MKNVNNKNTNTFKYSRRRFLQISAAAAVPLSIPGSVKAITNRSQFESNHLYWGDLHTHTTYSDGNGSPEDNFKIAKSHLDFWAMSDHAFDPVIFERTERRIASGRLFLNDHWDKVQQLCRDYEKNGEFIPFLGYEWTNFTYGHHNVYYLNYDQPIRIPATLPELYASLQGIDALVIPHHTGYPVGMTGKNWDYFDERLTRFAEIYSLHGSSEEPDGVVPLLTGGSWMGPGESGGSIQEGLERGHKFGIIASSDSHAHHPGAYDLGIMGVFAEELSRESLWEAFQKRRIIGVTGDRISLDFSLNDCPMGSVTKGIRERNINISAIGWNKIDRVDIIKNNNIIHAFVEPKGQCQHGEKARFRFFLEWGWDNTDDRQWEGSLTIGDGKIIQAVPCYRTNAARRLGTGIVNLTGSECQWKSKTQKIRYPIFLRYYGDGIAFEIECSRREEIDISLTCDEMKRGLKITPDEIMEKSNVVYMLDVPPDNKSNYWSKMESHAKFKIHQGFLTDELTLNLTFQDTEPEYPNGHADFYYIRLLQKNQQCAWSSPVWVEKS